MIALSDLVRMEAGTSETYTMYTGELPYFLKKLATYTMRARCKVHTRVATVIWDDSDTVSRMVLIKVIKSGKKLKRGKRT